MTDKERLLNLMTNSLIVSYTLAGAACVVFPRISVLLLLFAAVSVTAPYFVVVLFKVLATRWVTTLVVALLTLICPPLVVIGGILALVNSVMRYWQLFINIPFMTIGVILYGLIILPGVTGLSAIVAAQGWPVSVAASLAAGAVSALLLLQVLKLVDRYGAPRAHAAAVMFGVTSYLTVYVILLILTLSSYGHDSIDGGDGSDQWI